MFYYDTYKKTEDGDLFLTDNNIIIAVTDPFSNSRMSRNVLFFWMYLRHQTTHVKMKDIALLHKCDDDCDFILFFNNIRKKYSFVKT